MGLMTTAEQFNNLVLKEDGNRIVRFSDVGRAELGPADIKSYMKMNGVPMVGVLAFVIFLCFATSQKILYKFKFVI